LRAIEGYFTKLLGGVISVG